MRASARSSPCPRIVLKLFMPRAGPRQGETLANQSPPLPTTGCIGAICADSFPRTRESRRKFTSIYSQGCGFYYLHKNARSTFEGCAYPHIQSSATCKPEPCPCLVQAEFGSNIHEIRACDEEHNLCGTVCVYMP